MDPLRNPLKQVAMAVTLSFLGLTSITVPTTVSADGIWHHKESELDSLLPADQAFDLVSAERNGSVITLTWNIADGYYLYRKRIVFNDAAVPAAEFGTPALPDGETIHDEEQGDLEIYRHTLIASLPIAAGSHAPAKLSVRYQGCAEAGVCYPPQTRVIDVVEHP